MGSAQSRPDPRVEEKLAETLQTVRLASRSELENEYVYVNEKDRKSHSDALMAR